MVATNERYVGIDLGTGGVRALAIDRQGNEQGRASVALPASAVRRDADWHEQDAGAWWTATLECLQQLNERLVGGGSRRLSVRAVAVVATSGTIVPVDRHGRALARGMMYNDARAVAEAHELNQTARGDAPLPIGPAHPLAKWRWLECHRPEVARATRYFCHQADYIVGRLTGIFGKSDSSNSLKTGYDPRLGAWPAWTRDQGRLSELLPDVLPPATPIGPLADDEADAIGWERNALVVAGMTDGTAAFLASGATQVGDDNTTYGTTLVFKRLSEEPVATADGLIYSHCVPGGLWLPGAASNTGCDWISRYHTGADLSSLDAAAAAELPCRVLAYPLTGLGERFPFASPEARGFLLPADADPPLAFAARLQGTALLERLGHETLDEYVHAAESAELPAGDIFATGGGSRSAVWLQLRADVSGRRVHRPACSESAFGSALLAVAGAHGEALLETCRKSVKRQQSFEPNAPRHDTYQEIYVAWKRSLVQRGYLAG